MGAAKQQATYLAMISIGNYDVYRSTMTTTTGRRIPIWSFIEPKLGTQAAARALIPKAIRFAERRFGPIPSTVLELWSRTPTSAMPWRRRIGLSSIMTKARPSTI